MVNKIEETYIGFIEHNDNEGEDFDFLLCFQNNNQNNKGRQQNSSSNNRNNAGSNRQRTNNTGGKRY